MLGETIADPDGVEEGGSIRGMELLSVTTVLQKEKRRCQTEGKLGQITGSLEGMSGKPFRGYEIHMGKTLSQEETGEDLPENQPVIRTGANPNVYGSYVHGLFDQAQIAGETVQALAKKKGVSLQDGQMEDYQSFKEKQYDKLADTLRLYLNMEEVYGMLRDAGI